MSRDALTTVLLTVAWVCTTLGIATSDWLLTGAAAPSLAAATVLHVAASRQRVREAANAVKARRPAKD